jgi:hypothetical protein
MRCGLNCGGLIYFLIGAYSIAVIHQHDFARMLKFGNFYYLLASLPAMSVGYSDCVEPRNKEMLSLHER